MKIIIGTAILLVALVAGFFVVRSQSSEVFSSPDVRNAASAYESVSLTKLHGNLKGNEDRKIRIEGTIARECPSGCWFFVADKTGLDMKVELGYRKFAIPQRVGKGVQVEGTFIMEEDQHYVLADRVTVR